MIGIEPGETTTLVFGDRVVTAMVREVKVDHTRTSFDFEYGAPEFVPGLKRMSVTVRFDVVGVTEVTKEQAAVIATAIEEAAPGARQIDLEGA